MNEIDEILLEKIKSGDIEAFTALVRAVEHKMLCTSYRILGQHSDAEEVRQCVLLKIWEKPETLPAGDRFWAWLHRCVVNESIAKLRRIRREQERNAGLSIRPVQPTSGAHCCEVDQLRKAMDKLTPEQRAILSLKFDSQMTVRQIGQILEQPFTTVQSKLKKAVAELRALMTTSDRDEGKT
ncbi:MAG: RNA polymerase sigma factor [Planctomycetales bacterium]|nr:RNA polymerase sigma factor [Planctomycetales bacterium]